MFRWLLLSAWLLAALTGCEEPPAVAWPAWVRLAPAGAAPAADRLALVQVTDWSSGGLTVIDLETRQVQPLVTLTHSDALIRHHAGRLYVVNRLGQDNIQILDEYFTLVNQFSVGNGSNPQDLLVLDNNQVALVTRYAADPLRVRLPGGQPLATLDLSPWHGGDGSAETSFMIQTGEQILIAAQRLDNYAVVQGATRILVYTPTTGALTEQTTEADNPYTMLLPDPAQPGAVLVGMAGVFGTPDGGIERLRSDGTSGGLLITEEQLGGDIICFDLARNGSFGYALVAVPGQDPGQMETRLVRFSGSASQDGPVSPEPGRRQTTAGGPTETVLSPGSWAFGWIAINDRDEVYLADRTPTAPGVRVFEGASGRELTDRPLATGLPPFQLLFVP